MTTTQSGDRIRLWFLVTALSVGGTERTLVDLANGLDTETYDVTVWTLFDVNPLASDLDDAVDLRTLGLTGATGTDDAYVESLESPLDALRAPVAFAAALRRERPDVLQSFLFHDNVLARVTGLLSPDTTVVSGVRSVPNERPFARDLLDRATLPFADYVVSNSIAGAAFVVERGASAEDVVVVRNGRDVEAYADPSEVADPASFGASASAPVVGTVGRLVERKGHADLLRAWPAVRDDHPGATLVVVGDGPERDRLERLARSLGVAENVEFLGFRDDVPRLLPAFDVFAFPSHYEGLPGALLEAMAAGCPIVTTPVDGNAELVSNYRTGLFVDVESPDELADAVSLLLAHPSLADRLAENAQAEARASFTTDRMVDAFDVFYSRIASEDD